MTQLMAYAREHGHKSAWVSGLGGAGAATLGYYSLETRDYEWHEFEELLEILNLTGNLSWVDGEPFWHVHGTFSGHDMRAIGGHVKELHVALTCEVLVVPGDIPLTRRFDDKTGLKLLDLQAW